jgi:5-methylcytosine-specific restriction endonuclease McrA
LGREGTLVGRQRYQEYLRSPEWRARREVVARRSGGVCERCGGRSGEDARDLHHLHYRTLYDERPEDLQHLCRSCHRFVSGRDRLDPLASDNWLKFMMLRVERLGT